NMAGDLVDATTAATLPDLDVRRDIVERLMEDRDRLLLRLGLNLVKRTVDDRLGDRLLAVKHHGIHELGNDKIAELRIRVDLALFCTVASGHILRLSRSSARGLKQKRRSRGNP